MKPLKVTTKALTKTGNEHLKRAAFLRDCADKARKKADDLLRKHGAGVRAGWVSCDVAILEEEAWSYEEEADIMQMAGAETLDELDAAARMIVKAKRHNAFVEEVYQTNARRLKGADTT